MANIRYTIFNLPKEKACFRIRYNFELFYRSLFSFNDDIYGDDAYFYNDGTKTMVHFNYYGYANHKYDYLDSLFPKIRVYKYTEEYYTYKQSLYNYKENDSFLSEFSSIYPGMNQGFGIFCGYISQYFKIKLKSDKYNYG